MKSRNFLLITAQHHGNTHLQAQQKATPMRQGPPFSQDKCCFAILKVCNKKVWCIKLITCFLCTLDRKCAPGLCFSFGHFLPDTFKTAVPGVTINDLQYKPKYETASPWETPLSGNNEKQRDRWRVLGCKKETLPTSKSLQNPQSFVRQRCLRCRSCLCGVVA